VCGILPFQGQLIQTAIASLLGFGLPAVGMDRISGDCTGAGDIGGQYRRAITRVDG